MQKLFQSIEISTEIVDQLPVESSFVIDLRGLNRFSNASIEELLAVNTRLFQDAQICGKNLFDGKAGCLFLAFDNGLSHQSKNDRAWLGGISALAKTAKLEWPNAEVRSININCANKPADKIAMELFHSITSGGVEVEIEIDSFGKSYELICEVAAIENKSRGLNDGDTIIVSGGAKGVTAACLIALSKRKKINIGILGRTKLDEENPEFKKYTTDAELKGILFKQALAEGKKITPIEVNREAAKIIGNREIHKNIDTLERNGSQVSYHSVDISDQKEVEKAVSAIREEFGAIHGFVHAAGVLADRYIHEKTMNQFMDVFDTKLQGFRNLLQATSNDKLTHICCFSSVSARIGNVGQVDYAMANEILNKVCQSEQQRRGKTCVVKSLNWGPWDGGMVSPQLKKHFESMGVDLIPLETGAEIFADEMEDGSFENVEVVIGGSFEKWGNKEDKENGKGSFKLWVHRINNPYLSSHTIQDKIIVPMMMVNEWGLRLAKKLYSHLNIAEIKKMKVYKGIHLANFETTGDILSFYYESQKSGENTLVEIKVEGESKQLYYSFIVVMAEDIDAPFKSNTNLGDLKNWLFIKDDVYGPILFHGPDFQVINNLEGISSKGCKGELKISNSLFNDKLNWASEMFLFDGGVQLAALAIQNMTNNSSSLPLGFESLCIYDYEKLTDQFNCELTLNKQGDMNSEWDVFFKNNKQEVLAKLSGLRLYMYRQN
ncbi:SDR family NAD(P)-dependent oxidoreductase [Algoriphagus sp.]|uniref:SDR family NAD(P)-dependent oxidoreductase n=1 Tax=Algoriphagus sp. TaxID=1872435 RepID=UPI0025E24B12|nr:SDR family NAD(P)-dependent oxidoreductase [Algoriphagus sp.]